MKEGILEVDNHAENKSLEIIYSKKTEIEKAWIEKKRDWETIKGFVDSFGKVGKIEAQTLKNFSILLFSEEELERMHQEEEAGEKEDFPTKGWSQSDHDQLKRQIQEMIHDKVLESTKAILRKNGKIIPMGDTWQEYER